MFIAADQEHQRRNKRMAAAQELYGCEIWCGPSNRCGRSAGLVLSGTKRSRMA